MSRRSPGSDPLSVSRQPASSCSPGASTPISATYIRSCVQAGDIAAATAALGRPHRLDGLVERGDQRGRELGFPTVNLRPAPHAAIPADGVYAGRVIALSENGDTRTVLGDAAISIGTNPTFDGRQRRVEAFILDFDADLYGQEIGIEFDHRLRATQRFDSTDALVEQMGRDVAATREVMMRDGDGQ